MYEHLVSFGSLLSAAMRYSRLQMLGEFPRPLPPGPGTAGGAAAESNVAGGFQILFDNSDEVFAVAGVVPRIMLYNYRVRHCSASAVSSEHCKFELIQVKGTAVYGAGCTAYILPAHGDHAQRARMVLVTQPHSCGSLVQLPQHAFSCFHPPLLVPLVPLHRPCCQPRARPILAVARHVVPPPPLPIRRPTRAQATVLLWWRSSPPAPSSAASASAPRCGSSCWRPITRAVWRCGTRSLARRWVHYRRSLATRRFVPVWDESLVVSMLGVKWVLRVRTVSRLCTVAPLLRNAHRRNVEQNAST